MVAKKSTGPTERRIWKPTPAECKLIKQAASRESEPRLTTTQVKLCPNNRVSLVDGDFNINAALVSKQLDPFADTDLFDTHAWPSFRSGVTLTDDGRAVVDFSIRHISGDRFEDNAGLYGHVTVYYEDGKVTSIRGTGRTEYPVT